MNYQVGRRLALLDGHRSVIPVDFRMSRGTSAYPPLATGERTFRIGSFVPLPNSCSATKVRNQTLLNHLVGALLEVQRHVKAERFRSFEIDHQFELDWGLDRKLARLLATQNAIDIRRRTPKVIN